MQKAGHRSAPLSHPACASDTGAYAGLPMCTPGLGATSSVPSWSTLLVSFLFQDLVPMVPSAEILKSSLSIFHSCLTEPTFAPILIFIWEEAEGKVILCAESCISSFWFRMLFSKVPASGVWSSCDHNTLPSCGLYVNSCCVITSLKKKTKGIIPQV